MLRRKLEDVFKGTPLETPEMPLWSFSFHKSSSDKLFAEVSSWPVILLDVGNTAMTQSEPCPPRHTQRRVSSTHPARCPTGNTSPEPVPQIHTGLRNRSLHPHWARGGGACRNPRNVHCWQPPRQSHHCQSSALDRQYSPSETHAPRALGGTCRWGGAHTKSHTRGKTPSPRKGNHRPIGSQKHHCKVTHLQMDTNRWGVLSEHSGNSVKR